jgi:hypothetical protein
VHTPDAWREYADTPQGGTTNGAIEKAAVPLKLRPIHEIVAEQREPEWLIHKIIESHVLAVMAGPRGTFKSFVALDWAMRMARAGHAGVLLSGEGAGLDRRVDAWRRHHDEEMDLSTLPLVALEHAVNLNVDVHMGRLVEAIDVLERQPEFMVIDTLSKFSAGMDENSNREMAEFLAKLSAELRDKFSCTVLLVCHSGHTESGRPRGASALMCNPDVEYIIKREPPSMVVTVSRERFKDTAALPPLAYEAKVIDLGRIDSYGEPVASLALDTSDAPPMTPAKWRGKNQERLCTALKEWHRSNPDATHISSLDLDAMCKAQKIDRKRRIEVLHAFVSAKILSPSAGGHAFFPDQL